MKEEKKSKEMVLGVVLFTIVVIPAIWVFTEYLRDITDFLVNKLVELFTTPISAVDCIGTIIIILIDSAIAYLFFAGVHLDGLEKKVLSSAEIKIYKRAFVTSIVISTVVYSAFRALFAIHDIDSGYFGEVVLCLLDFMLMSFLNYVLREHALKRRNRKNRKTLQ